MVKIIFYCENYNKVRAYIMMPEPYLETYQSFKMECFAKIVNTYMLLTIFAKRSILDVSQGSGYASLF